MKQIINGKRYDTSTAELINSYEYSYPRDFNYVYEQLYRKKTGEFFIAGEGGPLSKYRQSCGQNEWSGGSRIVPLSFEDAQMWVEEHCSADRYEEIFGPVPEDDTAVLATFSLQTDVMEMLRRECQRTGRTQKDIVTDALKQYLNSAKG